MGKNLLWGILAIIFVWWLWRWVQGQGGILAAFNRAFPGMSTAPYWRYGIPTITGDVEDAIPPVIRRHTLPPITSDVEDAIPPTYQPTPTPVAPLPVVPLHPEMPPNIGLNDKLPWENNRRRGEVINALKADIARITRYSREVANTFTEVARVGGVDNYLSMQRERLTRARTLPSFVGPIGAVATPYQPTPTPVATPYQPTPTPVAPLPVAPGHPEMPPNIGLNDRLPWENNRRRGEVINALKADIARITRYSREVANTFTEVARVGGVYNYLRMQIERLTRARTLPAFVGPIGAVAPPVTGQAIDHSPLTPVPVFEIFPNRLHVSGDGTISTMPGGGHAYILP